mmetsp:Transcript_19216/g.19494  ORF Transcript_19216/g.19494 Transcript_19216/m.19494 type:complete len:513 (-) Transcript_19216:140-1678(-)
MFIRQIWVALVCYCQITNHVAASPRDDETFAKMIEHLRQTDNRLIRPSPTDETAALQNSYCPEILPLVIGFFVTSCHQSESSSIVNVNPVPKCTHAVEILTLCSTNHDTNRESIGVQMNVIPGLISMLRLPLLTVAPNPENGDDPEGTLSFADATRAAAAAGEAIWVLAFNHAENYDAFVRGGAVEGLSNLLVTCHGLYDNNAYADTQCYYPQMWAMAALQNLAASYCKTETGHCDWEWKMVNETDKHTKLVLSDDSPLKIDGEAVRLKIAKDEDLLDALGNWLCQGPVDDNVDPNRVSGWNLWPSEAILGHGYEELPSMVTWAAVGVWKNLAISQWTHELHFDEPFGCLCIVSLSDDWIEASKAHDALYHIGVANEEVDCFEERLRYLHDDFCQDEPSWEDSQRNSCATYKAEQLCVYADDLAEAHSDIESASEACCVCGGGTIFDPATCVDLEEWKDGDGDGCGVYEEHAWCFEHGGNVDGYGNGVSADTACCVCGGGLFIDQGGERNEL